MRKLADFHPRHNTFPGEELLELAADAIDESGASRVNSIDYEGIRERNLPEYVFRGKSEHRKSHFALTAAVMIRAGVDPDLLGEVSWWNTDDLWVYCFYALLASYGRPPLAPVDRPKLLPSRLQEGVDWTWSVLTRSVDARPEAAPGGDDKPSESVSAWAPFHHPTFAAMWSAQFVSNIGSWMQTVAAQWLMLTLTASATYVALVQTAASLPVVLFAVLAGAAGDLVDRRRFLLIAQGLMLIAATALGVLALDGLVTPWVLLALIFAVGSGQALTSPTWQTLQPELVPAPERPQAISLGSVNQNLARAVGPAIGGLLLAATTAGTVFLANAATFLAVIGVLVWWRSAQRPPDLLPREHVGEAMRAGGRYVAASPILRAILVRAALFIFFASSIWALLPIVAQSDLHLGSGGYGLLLGSVGIGAVIGAANLPRLRGRRSPGVLLTVGSFGLAVVALILAYVHVTAVVAIALVVGGVAWILALSTLNSLYQLSLPGWAKARGMSFYLIVFQGGNAVGSAVMGISAVHLGLSPTLLVAGGALALGPIAGLRYRFQPIAPEDLMPAGELAPPVLAADTAPGGPVMVGIQYHSREGLTNELLAALEATRFSRRRTGAINWRVWQDASDPSRVIEQFVVASWSEHLRQHERVSKRDQERLDAVRALTDPDRPTTITHWVTPQRQK